MLAYPNVRVQANENTVWQRTISEDNYTFDVGMRPTEMFMRFNDDEFITYDGSSLEISSAGTSAGLKLNGYMNLYANGVVVPGFYLYNESGVGIGGMYDSIDNLVVYATNRLTLTSGTNDIRLSGVSTDNTEDYVVAIDNTSGKLSKRTVASISGGGGPTLYQTSVTLNQSQIQQLRTSPYTLVSAPGEGYIISPVSATAIYVYDTAAFTGTSALYMQNENSINRLMVTSADFVSSPDSKIEAMRFHTNPEIIENDDLVLITDQTASNGGANSTITVDLIYRIIAV